MKRIHYFILMLATVFVPIVTLATVAVVRQPDGFVSVTARDWAQGGGIACAMLALLFGWLRLIFFLIRKMD